MVEHDQWCICVAHVDSELTLSLSETGIFWENFVNTIATDDLAPCVVKSSASMSLTTHDTQIFFFTRKVINNLPVLQNEKNLNMF